jgi:hypothetical protein
MRSVIKIVILQSHTGGNDMWNHLHKHWHKYGGIQLIVTYQPNVTLDSLLHEDPDILVCSDPSGAPYQYTDQELSDIKTYVNQGHHILGTYLTFYHQEKSTAIIYDNRQLCSLFGITTDQSYTRVELPKTIEYVPLVSSPLWKHVTTPYLSHGYNYSQYPVNNGWYDVLQPDTRVMGQSHDSKCVILNHVDIGFTSMYISHMAEYDSLSHSDDVQFLYNCFVYLNQQKRLPSLTTLCMRKIARHPRKFRNLSCLPVELIDDLSKLKVK